VTGCDTLSAMYESMYGEVSMYMTACEEMMGLPGDVEWEERNVRSCCSMIWASN